ncbi:MAG: hypothetical protein K2M05_01295 [Paramuribaculum sp.]|nr:hypothetical protein [Paramuribaculum sp.]
MKRILILPLFIAMMFMALSPAEVSAGDDSSSNDVTLKKKFKKNNGDENKPGGRAPARPIFCTISPTNGIYIPDFTDEIIAYEIWNDSNDSRIASFSEESAFINYLYSNPDNYCIQLLTSDYILIGYLSTL